MGMKKGCMAGSRESGQQGEGHKGPGGEVTQERSAR